MTCRIRTLTALAVAAFVTTTALPADAGQRPCIREAKGDAKECAATCKEDFQTAKDACLNRDHACVEICRANRSQCRLETGFDALIDACNEALETAREACRNAPDRDACVDRAQVNAFECRDSARELTKPALKHCRKDFRACAKACPVPDPPTPSDDPKACVAAGKDAARQCAAACKEDFQVAKDDCRHRDHACVEQCRAARHDCRQPVRADLEAALAACAAARTEGIDGTNGCKAQYPEPRDQTAQIAFDQCVDGVQVAAFICRDNAHEAARPRFATCQQQFRSCVQTNCPPLN